MSLTDKSALSATEEMSIKIKADKENNMLHITDTGELSNASGGHVRVM